MPYVKQSIRDYLDGEVLQPDDPGQLNYKITGICLDYVDNSGQSYQTYNDIIGALECAKLEMYRRAIAPYEDKKITENGDLFN